MTYDEQKESIRERELHIFELDGQLAAIARYPYGKEPEDLVSAKRKAYSEGWNDCAKILLRADEAKNLYRL